MRLRKIRELVKTYSQYIHYPILLEVEKDVEKEVPVDEVDEVRGTATVLTLGCCVEQRQP